MPLLDIDIPTAQTMFETNVWGVMRMIQVFSPLLIASKGTIINNSSVAAYVPSPFLSAYNMTKASLTMMSNTLRYEMAPFDVKVIVVSHNRSFSVS
jgi:1-acylglycerone phosphate reductase